MLFKIFGEVIEVLAESDLDAGRGVLMALDAQMEIMKKKTESRDMSGGPNYCNYGYG